MSRSGSSCCLPVGKGLVPMQVCALFRGSTFAFFLFKFRVALSFWTIREDKTKKKINKRENVEREHESDAN